ncbi:MAG: hypothetical protein WDO73_26625 [Ignavibacteriota bacterium]
MSFPIISSLPSIGVPPASKCDKGYDTANGCLAHGMKRYYGAVIAEPQGFHLRPSHPGDLHRQRNAGELQGRGGPR